MTVDRLNRRLCTHSLKTLGALGGGRLAWPRSPRPGRRRGPDERSTIVVAATLSCCAASICGPTSHSHDHEVGIVAGCLQRPPLGWSGDVRVLGDLGDVAVRGADVHPGAPAVVNPDSKRISTPADRSSVGSWRLSTRNPAIGPVVRWRLIGLSGPRLPLAPVWQLEHPEPRLVQLEPKAQDITEEGDGRGEVVGPGPHPGQLDAPHS